MDKNITQFMKVPELKPDAELHLVQEGKDYKTTVGDVSGLSKSAVVEIQEFLESNIAILNAEIGQRWYLTDTREIQEVIAKNQVTGSLKFKYYVPYNDAIYMNISDGRLYRWDGNSFVYIVKNGGAVSIELFAPKKVREGLVEFTQENGFYIVGVKEDTKLDIFFDDRFDLNKRLIINQIVVSQIIFPDNIVWLETPDFSQPGVYHVEFKICVQDPTKLLALVTFKEPVVL